MISNISAYNGNRYVQSFGNRYGYKEIKNNPYYSDEFLKSSTQDNVKEKYKTSKFSNCTINTLNKVVLREGINKIKEVENEFLYADSIPDNSLKRIHDCRGETPEEQLLSGLLLPDIYLYNGKPFTGYAIAGSKEDAVYTKYDNGRHVMTFIRNELTGFAGYTDEVNECAKYCSLTNTRKTLLSSQYQDGVNKVKLITADTKGLRVKNYTAVDDVDDKETRKLVEDVQKCFVSDYLDTPFYIFA